MDSSLSPELRELEEQLSSMVPCALLEQQTEQFATAMGCEAEQCLCDDESGLDELEKHLEQISPATMRTDILSRMVSAMDTWYEQVPVEEKVVSFRGKESDVPTRRARSGGMIAAAAAVAVLGAAAALVMPGFMTGENNHQAPTAYTPPADHVNDRNVHLSGNVEPADAWVVPVSSGYKVVNSRDRGLVMTADNTPHRCIQLHSLETIKLEDESGREITIERPSVNYLLVPVEAN